MSLEKQLYSAIDAFKDEVITLAKKIHDNPEVAYQEHFAAKEQIQFLSKNNFKVEKGLSNLSTSFKASWYGEGKGKVVAFLSEYDALPGIGHGCGHQLIAGSAIAAALGVKMVMEKNGLNGTVSVIGTPAEENGGGKISMKNAGCFKNIDACLMFHPSNTSLINTNSLCNLSLAVEFYGKEAHAGTCPEEGRSALSALINVFNNLNSIRLHFTGDLRAHGVIKQGGIVENVIPKFAEGLFTLRALNMNDLNILKERFVKCVEGAALTTGTEYKITEKFCYTRLEQNKFLNELFKRNMEALGEIFSLNKDSRDYISTDAGNLSTEVPLIHPLISVIDGTENCVLHTSEFEYFANTQYAYDKMILVSKSLGATALDFMQT